MNRLKKAVKRLLNPPLIVIILITFSVYPLLILIFLNRLEKSAGAYVIYLLSAYALAIAIIAVAKNINKAKAKIKKLSEKNKIIHMYSSDSLFKDSFGIIIGMSVNLLYAVFRMITGIIYSSVWFISVAVYYCVLAFMKAYLAVKLRKKDKTIDYELNCYRKTAVFLFLLNIPMGGMIILTIKTNSGFSYPGYIVYVSALYTFFILSVSVYNIIKQRSLKSPIISASKVINFISATMSVLALQTAMIASFSNNDNAFRKLMNTITGTFVYVIVIITAIIMLIHSKNGGKIDEQIGE